VEVAGARLNRYIAGTNVRVLPIVDGIDGILGKSIYPHAAVPENLDTCGYSILAVKQYAVDPGGAEQHWPEV